ncbi:MAG TPA: hypothetical protein PK384_08660, partial [Candidatus Latescibacteria bacterium]|nr:hypothetical protein [Candidatus Latescibacterota bacterium]
GGQMTKKTFCRVARISWSRLLPFVGLIIALLPGCETKDKPAEKAQAAQSIYSFSLKPGVRHTEAEAAIKKAGGTTFLLSGSTQNHPPIST